MEFAEAKDRLKASWAVDRDDFARVKEQLKKKNAEHHVQNGRLSQSLKARHALPALRTQEPRSTACPLTLNAPLPSQRPGNAY